MKRYKTYTCAGIGGGVVLTLLLLNADAESLSGRTFFSANTGFYFFSAILQANAAILSIVGVFIIFRIQSHHNSIDAIRNSFMLVDARGWSQPGWFLDFDNSSLEQKRQLYEKSRLQDYVRRRMLEWIEKEEEIERIKSLIKLPTCFLSAGMVLSTIGLLLSNALHLSYENAEFCTLFAFGIFEIITIVLVVRTIYKSFA